MAKIDLDAFNIFVEGQGLANEYHDEKRISGEGQEVIDEVSAHFVEGDGEANINYDDHLRGTTYTNEEIDNYQRDDNTTDHYDKYQTSSTKTDRISGYQISKTSTEKISTKDYTKSLKSAPKFEEIKGSKKPPPTFEHDGDAPLVDDPWSMDTMSSHDSDLFEQELSFISLDEEDKLYADKRAAPRAKPPEGKMVTIQSQIPGKKAGVYTLHDLSQGGMGFIIYDKNEYEREEIINILGFDDKSFEQPMVVQIKAIREADELGVQFKVGCAFI